jgi:ADP-ribose pyrophosphatase
MDKPIVPKDIRRVFDGRVFTVQVESIALPNGLTLKAEIVRHPGSVVIIPVTGTGEVILVRQYRHAIGRSAWELPAGSLKPGEDVVHAAIRECHEEIGLVPARVEALGSFFPTPGYCDEEMHFYLASGLRPPSDGESAQPDEDEDIEPKAFAVEAIRRMISSGEIIDLKTVAGVALLTTRRPDPDTR